MRRTSLLVLLALCALSLSSINSNHSAIRFREIGSQAGLTGRTIHGAPSKTAVIEVNGSGLCWLDYNDDGLLDLFVVNGSTLDWLRAEQAAKGRGPQRDYLYRNDGDGTFSDVTEQAGIYGYSWGTGAAAADYDNDGDVDLFVSNIGECNLYQNQGDGTFVDIARQAGVSGGFNWHTGAAFGDYDADGYLDLYVAAYLNPSHMLEEQKKCDWRGLKVYCGPVGQGAPDVLYRNNGDGTFSNVTREAGVEDRDLLYGFTATFEDFDNDGKLDIIVANDLGRNYLYHNLGSGKFEEVGEIWGIAYPAEGKAQANMGVAIGDYDRNGTMDVFVTTFSLDHYTLFKNMGSQIFLDASTETALARSTYYFLGWGTFFADFDNDGTLELFAVNGHIYPEVDEFPSEFQEGYAQRPLLFTQARPGVFTDISAAAGLAELNAYSSRGAAYADFDNDGDLDIVYSSLDARPMLLENVSAPAHAWVTIKLVGTKSNRDGIGARLKLTAGDLIQYATLRSGESFLSGNDPRLHFGLGHERKIDSLEIRWPSGYIETIHNLPVNRVVKIEEGNR